MARRKMHRRKSHRRAARRSTRGARIKGEVAIKPGHGKLRGRSCVVVSVGEKGCKRKLFMGCFTSAAKAKAAAAKHRA